MNTTSDPWGSPDKCLAWAHKLTSDCPWTTCTNYIMGYDAVSRKWCATRLDNATQLGFVSTSFEECKAWLIAVILTGA